MAHARSLMATTGRLEVQERTNEAAIATGSSVSAQGRMENTSGTGLTRGASRAGTRRVGCSAGAGRRHHEHR